jgi:hypothetical protein
MNDPYQLDLKKYAPEIRVWRNRVRQRYAMQSERRLQSVLLQHVSHDCNQVIDQLFPLTPFHEIEPFEINPWSLLGVAWHFPPWARKRRWKQ